MATKAVSPQFNILGSTPISGTTAITSSVSSILYRDSVCYQLNATGSPAGNARVEVSTDYSPGLPQGPNGTEGANSGNWCVITSVSVLSGTEFPIVFDLNQLSMPWSRCVFTSSTASGTISIWTSAKSLS